MKLHASEDQASGGVLGAWLLTTALIKRPSC